MNDTLNALQAALREPEPKAPATKGTPALSAGERALAFTYRTPDGVSHDCTLVLRLLSFDERHRVELTLTRLLGGVSPDSVAASWVEYARAAITVRVLWPDLPDWLSKAIDVDEDLALALYDQVEVFRGDYFRGLVLSGGEAAGVPRLVIHKAQPA